MKKTHFLLFAICIVLASCHKDDDDQPTNPVDQLPPATQTGAGTFACLVNGRPFIDNSGSFNCFYQFVDGGYYFGISGEDTVRNLIAINISTYDKSLTEGETYLLINDNPGNAWGGVF